LEQDLVETRKLTQWDERRAERERAEASAACESEPREKGRAGIKEYPSNMLGPIRGGR